LEALDSSQESVTKMMETYARRRDLVREKLCRANRFAYTPPEGTFFSLLDIRRFERDSESVADYLMREGNVVTIPGRAYGEAGEGYLRLSFAYDEQALERGIDAMVEALERL
jgi:aspartate/methionine/tyrosine aminotransferase